MIWFQKAWYSTQVCEGGNGKKGQKGEKGSEGEILSLFFHLSYVK